LIVGAAFEYSKVKFSQNSTDIATLDPSGFFSGALGGKEQTSGLTGKTYTSSIFRYK
jgi:hypothetical protein